MTHGTEHHLEEAEHFQHAKHDPFDRRVAMTMAIVAAALACVTLLSHRAHNATLQHQIESAQNITSAVDQWGYYQAKKNRQYALEASTEQMAVHAHAFTDPKARADAEKTMKSWKGKTAKWEKETKEIQQKAIGLDNEAKKYAAMSVEAHHRGDRYDLGELGVELALVLCSIAVLTKKKEFWYSGILIGVIGFGVAMSGLFLSGHHGHAADHPASQEHQPAPEHKSSSSH